MTFAKNTPAQSINELVTINGGVASTTSRKIAKAFGKAHKEVLRDIKNLGCSSDFHERNFALSQYIQKMPTGGDKIRPEYQVTRNGFVILAMGYTGERAMQFKEMYIARYDEMESQLRNEFLPPLAEGDFAGLMPIHVGGRLLLCYTDVLRKIGRSTKSGSLQARRKRYPNHFFKLLNRNFITSEFAHQLLQEKALEMRRNELQLSLPFGDNKNEGGRHA